MRFSRATPLTNVYARATVGGVGFALDATEAADHFVGSLGSTAKTSYWYINQPSSGNGTFRVRLYLGDPAAGGTLQAASPLCTLRRNGGDQAAAAKKVTTITVNGGNPVQLEQRFDVVAQYAVNSAGPDLLVQPAALASFDPHNLRLGATRVRLCSDTACGGVASTLNNQLHFTAGGGDVNGVRATYTFQTVGVVSVNVSLVVVVRSGQYKYNADFAAPTVSPAVPAPVNRGRIAKSVDLAQSPGGLSVTYTLTALNSGTVAVNLDDFVDTLPPSPVAGSSKLNGVAFANPLVAGQALTWRDPGGWRPRAVVSGRPAEHPGGLHEQRRRPHQRERRRQHRDAQQPSGDRNDPHRFARPDADESGRGRLYRGLYNPDAKLRRRFLTSALGAKCRLLRVNALLR